MTKKLMTFWVRDTTKILLFFGLLLVFMLSSGRSELATSTQNFDAQQKLTELLVQISGRENEPSEKVFKNIQRFNGIEAARLLRAMNSFSRALGVSCAHCHILNQWEKDEQPVKQVAREMITLTRTINNDLLKKIPNLKSQNPSVTCTTCHRGQLTPEVNLPESKTKP